MDTTNAATLALYAKDLGELLKNVAGPATEELGEYFRDRFRLYRIKNVVKVLTEVERMLASAGICPQSIKPQMLCSLLEGASWEDDPDLQRRWAALLANAAITENSANVLPSFVEILKTLTPSDVKFLSRLFDHLTANQSSEIASEDDVRETSLGTESELLEFAVPAERYAEELAFGNRSKLRVMLGNFCRVGLLRFTDRMVPTRNHLLHKASLTYANDYVLTPFGYSFLLACDPPRQGDRNFVTQREDIE